MAMCEDKPLLKVLHVRHAWDHVAPIDGGFFPRRYCRVFHHPSIKRPNLWDFSLPLLGRWVLFVICTSFWHC